MKKKAEKLWMASKELLQNDIKITFNGCLID